MSEVSCLGKHSRSYYRKSSKKGRFGVGSPPRLLSAGIQGVLITTGDKESLCVSEAYSLLNEYGDTLYGPEIGPLDSSSDSEDVAADHKDKETGQLEKKGSGGEDERRFRSLNSGARHVVFIKCSEQVDPLKLVHFMLSNIHTTQTKKSRFCQRILPVVNVCHASLDEIEKCAVTVLEPHFHTNTTDSHTFAVNYKSRNNNAIKRDDVIKVVANLVTREDEYPHRVDLHEAELVIIVEIIKNLCCLSVVRDFHKLRKYNISLLTEPHPSSTAETKDKTDTKKGILKDCQTTKDSEQQSVPLFSSETDKAESVAKLPSIDDSQEDKRTIIIKEV